MSTDSAMITQAVEQTVQAAGQATKKSNGVLYVAIFFVVVILGILLAGLYLMWKQKEAEKATSQKSKGANSEPPRDRVLVDAKKLVEGVERVEDGIIVTDKGKRYVAAITCRGLDFYNENTREQLSVMQGYQGFWNIVSKPITYRLYTKAVDIDPAKERYVEKYHEYKEEYEQVSRELQIAQDRHMDEETIRNLTENMDFCKNRVQHMLDQMNAMEFYSSTDVVKDMTQDYIFDWVYEPNLSDAPMTSDDIFFRAKIELETIAGQMITALSGAGVKARMCNNDEILDMLRRNSKPIASELYKQRFVASSSMDEDIVSSDSIENVTQVLYEEECEEIGEIFGEKFRSMANGRGVSNNEEDY